MGKLNLHCWCADIQQHLNKVEKTEKSKKHTASHIFFSTLYKSDASSIVQILISHAFFLLLKPLPYLGAEWIVEWKEFLSKVPVCRATVPPLPRLAAAPPPTYFEWRDVWNFVWIAVKWEIWVLTRKAFTRFAYAPPLAGNWSPVFPYLLRRNLAKEIIFPNVSGLLMGDRPYLNGEMSISRRWKRNCFWQEKFSFRYNWKFEQNSPISFVSLT